MKSLFHTPLLPLNEKDIAVERAAAWREHAATLRVNRTDAGRVHLTRTAQAVTDAYAELSGALFNYYLQLRYNEETDKGVDAPGWPVWECRLCLTVNERKDTECSACGALKGETHCA